MTNSSRAIAIVGYACRLPKADNATAFWSVLEKGECVVSEIQSDRWARNRFGHSDRQVSGRSYTWRAGQIDDPWGFDPTFFGISPREALQIDPQQRVLLQVVWEALEHAGIPASRIAGSETGVYVGASSVDYSNNFVVDPAAMDIQMMTGNTLSIVSNRISYVFDLKGPSFTVDTACSSSIVALHEALEAMRSGRIDTAIVGGVNMLLSPFAFVGFSRASMLSPTGLCRAFDADGDGYVRSEGAIAFVLKTVEAARAAGDPIRGVLVGSGINSDGRTVGLSLPSSQQQAALLSHVYERFEIDPAALAYVEAHGTGTRVGDPAEANALGEILGKRRSDRLPIGSVKTNIGHLEAASGLAGLLKAQLSLEKRVLPPSLHFVTPNPDIAFDDLNIEVVTAARPMVDNGTPMHIGINSFGFGGANAHAVLREPAAHEINRERKPSRPGPLVISAQSPEALAALATSYRDRLAVASGADVANITNAAAHHRDRLDHRVVALGNSADALKTALDNFLAKERATNHVAGRAAARQAPIAFVFSGNGSQWAGMGKVAYQTDAAFRASFDIVTRQFIRVAGWSLLTELFSADLEQNIERTEIAQPLLFAIQVATVDALAARGLKPDMVAGHSVGEVAAAWAAGALPIEAAVFLIHVRSTQQEVTRHLGGMAALLVSAADARKALDDPRFSQLELGADNSPRSVTISGTNEQLAEFAKVAKKNRWALRKLKLDYPFHSALINPIRKDLTNALATLQPHETTIPFISSVTGKVAEGTALNAEYWWLNVRQPVLFRPAIETLAELDAKVFIEIGPKPVLNSYIVDSLAGANRFGASIASLDTGDAEGSDLFSLIVARALVHGARIDDDRFFGLPAAQAVDLPIYPWQNQDYRVDPSADSTDMFGRGDDHPLLGFRLKPGSGPWSSTIDTTLVPWLADHKVEASTVFPAAGFVEMALSAARIVLGPGPIEIRDFDIMRPMVLEQGEPVQARVEVDAAGDVIDIESRRRLSGDDFALHVRARIARPPVLTTPSITLPEGDDVGMEAEALYRLTRRFGLDYGPAFQRAVSIVPAGEKSLVVTLSAAEGETVNDAGFVLHPTLLDASFHGLFWLITRDIGVDADTSFLPVRIGNLRVYRDGATPSHALITVSRASTRSVEASFTLVDHDGAVIARAEGVRFKAVRLNKASDPDEFIFTTGSIRLADASEPVELPASWSQPADRIASLGFAQEQVPDLDEASLLMDAGCRALVFDTLVALADESGFLSAHQLVESDQLAASALPLFNRLILGLEEDGAADRLDDGFRLAAESPYPPVETVIATIVASHPRRIAEATTMVRLRSTLASRLRTGLVGDLSELLPQSLADHLDTSAPVSAPLHDVARGIALDLAGIWPADRPLRLLLIGPESGALARVLASMPRVSSVVVTEPDSARLDRLRIDLESGDGIEILNFSEIDSGARAYDVAILVGMLGRKDANAALDQIRARLASAGLIVAIDPEQSLFSDLVYGQISGWWNGSVDPEFPIGARREAADHAVQVGAAGFVQTSALAVSTDQTHASIVVARAPHRGAEAVEAKTDPVLILVDGDKGARKVSDALAAVLASRGRPVRVAAASRQTDGRIAINAIDAGNDSDLIALLSSGEVKDVVFAPGVAEADADRVMAASTTRVMILHAVLNGSMKPPARLWIMAPGGSGAARNHRAVETGIWGLGRVIMNEYPDVETRIIDLTVAFQPSEAAERIADVMASPGPEREIAIDERGLSAIRIKSGPGLSDTAGLAQMNGPAARSLVIERQGTLDGLAWRHVPRREPEPDEVEIEVAAAGLNFRDVMWALGLLPDEALEDGFAGATLGMECSGIVTRVGSAVTRFQPGSRVISFAPACFSTHVTVAEKALAPVPSTVQLEAAATIPVTFLTAYYALVELAHLEEGETILIHGGAGGVGLAALQIALSRGAKVIATAGSADKRSLLSMLGAAHVLDSRSLAFADEVKTLTGGKGVDVVLNSLFGAAMERSLEVLRPFGRFVELGKRDYYANTQIALRPFRQNLSYFGVDADQLLTHRPKLTERLFRELVAGFESGAFTALPYRIFAPDRITEAFRLMQQSGHTGKILVRPPAIPVETRTLPVTIRADATYLVAGGLGGFGMETARFLVERGARYLVLTSRSGKASDTAQPILADLRARGARIDIVAADVTKRGDVENLFKRIEADMPPLKGILHTAMVIDDALFMNLDEKRMDAVMAPKIAGAALLDACSRSVDLDLFVLYSSATTLIGNPGQAPYVTANAFMEGLARTRRAAGLPATAVAWGAIADAGYLARNSDVNDMLSMRLGKQALTARAALAGLGLVLDSGTDEPVIAYARIDWAAARRELALMETPLPSRIAEAVADTGSESMADGQLASMIAGLDHAAAVKVVVDLLGAEISRILRLPADSIDPTRPLTEVGMDSLLALELRMAAEQRLGVDIPMMSLANGASLADIARRTVEKSGAQAGTEAASSDAEIAAARHLDGEADEDLVAIASAVEAKADKVKRLI